jgi:zinc D-Ala-D-Ala carboxypeptidase
MALDPGVRLSPHFTAHELGADTPGIPDAAVHNLTLVAAWLERLRAAIGEPVVVTSGYRTPAHNTEIGGSPTSDHPNGLAADVEAPGLTGYALYRRLQGVALPPFDQLIFYALDNHLHVGLGPRMRGERLVKTTEGSYVALAESTADKIRGYLEDHPGQGLAVLVGVGVAFALLGGTSRV